MKKTISIALSVVLMLSLSACADKPEENDVAKVTEPLEILNTVWTSYGDTEKFDGGGGSGDNMNMDGAGKFDITDTESLDATLGFPAAEVGKIDAAASLMHMMNANTFTCGVYRVTDSADVESVAAALKDNIMKRQWMCGIPEKLVIASVDDCVLAFFGNGEIIETFKGKLSTAYTQAVIISEDAIA